MEKCDVVCLALKHITRQHIQKDEKYMKTDVNSFSVPWTRK